MFIRWGIFWVALIVGCSQNNSEKGTEEALRQAHEELERRVRERTAELRNLVNAMAGREVRMAELKEVIRQLHTQLEDAGLTPVADDPLLAGGRKNGK